MQALRRQIADAHWNGLLTRSKGRELRTYQRNTAIGREACQVADVCIKSHVNKKFTWNCRRSSGEESLPEGVQTFNGKSQTLLNTGSLTLYPLHITLITFSNDCHRSHIKNGNTVMGTSSKVWCAKYGNKRDRTKSFCERVNLPLVRLPEILYKCIKLAKQPLS